jgi:uncharacterized protein
MTPFRWAALGLLAGVLLALALGLAGRSTGASDATAKLRLDGAALRPELALTSGQRSRGLMHRRKAPADGMLFVFTEPTRGVFWMKNTLVPLSIVFYNSRGTRVRRLLMTPCTEDPCRTYNPGRSYRFALELAAGDPRPAKQLGPLAELRRLIRRAS